MDITKYRIIPMTKSSHKVAIRGLLSSPVFSEKRVCFYFSIADVKAPLMNGSKFST